MCAACISSVTIQRRCLEMQSLVSTPDYCHWEPEIRVLSILWINVMHRAIWDSSRWGECSVVIQTCWEHSPWLAVVSSPILFTFYVSFCFQRGGSKEILCPKKLEKKRQERAFRQGQADMSWQILRLTGCTFQKPVTKITSHQCGQVSLVRGDPRRSCSKSVHSGGCRTSRPTTLKENLSEPWTAQMFQGLSPWYCRWVPGSCRFQISAHQPWAHHS